MPKLRRQTFETAIIERYQRREISVEEALVEMYLAGVSVRRVEDITEALWGTRVSPGTVSNLNKKIYEQIEAWRKDAAKQYESGIEAFLSALQIASKSDVQRIDRKISQLNRKLREMEKPKATKKVSASSTSA